MAKGRRTERPFVRDDGRLEAGTGKSRPPVSQILEGDAGMIGLTGVTGEVGRRLVDRFSGEDVPLRMIARDSSRVPPVANAEVVAFGGYGEVSGMQAAFTGVTTLFLCSARESADRVAQHRSAVDAAVAAGVQRIVYLSFIGAHPSATFTFARDHFHTEDHIRRSGLAFTFSRQNLYMDLLPVLGGEEGVIRGPAGAGRVAPVLRDDVADALHTVLREQGHEGATYELTGPESLTLAEVAAKLTRYGGRTISYEDETLEQARASRAGYGAPEWELEGWISTYTAIAAGELDVVTDHVARLTGHEPASVDEFLSRQ